MNPLGRFDGYGVFITGAGRGIGAAIATRLATEGAHIFVTDVDTASADETAAILRGRGLTADSGHCDVSDSASVDAAVARAADTLNSLDVLVNNAYSCTPDAELFEDEPDEVWAKDLDVTLTGAYRCSRAALPQLVASGRGAIVNIGSVNGLQDFGNHSYSAAKAGLVSLTRTLAGHAAPRGVRVNLVAPGTVRTPAWAGRDEALDEIKNLYPLGRVGAPEDVAAAVAFLASSDASWITGTVVPVDGGILAVNSVWRKAASD